MSTELNLSILSALRFSPVLIESFDIRSSDFEPGKERAVFSAISAMWEDSRPAEIDPVLLVEKLGPDFSSFVGSLMNDRVKISPEIFKARCLELKRHGVSKKIASLSQDLSGGFLKTGQFDQEGLDGIKQQLQELEKINAHPEDNGSFFGTAEDFMAADIPPEEIFCDPILSRCALVEVGGMKGTHKSFFMNSLALHLAAGRSPFLDFMILKPYRVLLIQQEISLGQHRARMERMIKAGQFETGGRLFTFTTTGRQRKLEKAEDLAEIKKWISERKPDVLLLDPLSSFEQGEENNSRDRKRTVSILNELKATFGLALVVSHHFSSKVSPDDPLAPREAGGWFRGHSAFPDAADSLICLHRLPGQRENPNLPKSYEDYNLVEIQLRNNRWPAKFAIEFDEDSFLLKPSTVWEDIRKKIIPGEITDYIDEQGGEALYKDILEHFKNKADRTTVRRAIKTETRAGTLEEDRLPGKGRPLVIRRLNVQPPEPPAYPSI